jgi:hypothetical protein
MGPQLFIIGIIFIGGLIFKIRHEDPFTMPFQKLIQVNGIMLFSLFIIIMGAILAAMGT